MQIDTPLLKVEKLAKSFGKRDSKFTVFQDLDLVIGKGETVALVGESACGKSTFAKSILRLLEPDSGAIFFEGKDLVKLSSSQLRSFRQHLQMVFQNPLGSLNPRMSVCEILEEPLKIHGLESREGRLHRAEELMEFIGLRKSDLDKYPHQFSGGQCQRIAIARALATRPKFIVCDEPLSALDVSIQAQMIDLLLNIQHSSGVSYLFITHDLAAAYILAHRLVVMYLGQFVEQGKAADICQRPLHPYTQALVQAVLSSDPDQERKKSRVILKGEVPSRLKKPEGCPFHSRCPFAMPICKTTPPVYKEVEPGHFTACHLYN